MTQKDDSFGLPIRHGRTCSGHPRRPGRKADGSFVARGYPVDARNECGHEDRGV